MVKQEKGYSESSIGYFGKLKAKMHLPGNGYKTKVDESLKKEQRVKAHKNNSCYLDDCRSSILSNMIYKNIEPEKELIDSLENLVKEDDDNFYILAPKKVIKELNLEGKVNKKISLGRGSDLGVFIKEDYYKDNNLEEIFDNCGYISTQKKEININKNRKEKGYLVTLNKKISTPKAVAYGVGGILGTTFIMNVLEGNVDASAGMYENLINFVKYNAQKISQIDGFIRGNIFGSVEDLILEDARGDITSIDATLNGGTGDLAGEYILEGGSGELTGEYTLNGEGTMRLLNTEAEITVNGPVTVNPDNPVVLENFNGTINGTGTVNNLQGNINGSGQIENFGGNISDGTINANINANMDGEMTTPEKIKTVLYTPFVGIAGLAREIFNRCKRTTPENEFSQKLDNSYNAIKKEEDVGIKDVKDVLDTNLKINKNMGRKVIEIKKSLDGINDTASSKNKSEIY